MKRHLTFETLSARRTLSVCPMPDANLGDDAHGAALDESTTRLALENEAAEVCSFIDRDADGDAFRLDSPTAGLELLATAEARLILGFYRADGELLTTWESRETSPRVHEIEPRELPAVVDGPLFLLLSSTKGGRGGYHLVVRPVAETSPADLDQDGRVAFSDFLILSGNFGRTTTATPEQGDIDGDQDVDFADFLLLSNAFGHGS